MLEPWGETGQKKIMAVKTEIVKVRKKYLNGVIVYQLYP